MKPEEIVENILGYHLSITGSDLKLLYECLPYIRKSVPLKLKYKNGFAFCNCGCEYESEGYQGEEFCLDCGQKVWVGGFNGEVKNNVITFK